MSQGGHFYFGEIEMVQLKQPTTYQEQLDLLQRRNVVVDDPAHEISILEEISYYRLTAYLLPFKQKDGKYQQGTRLYTAYRIYEFDRKLRGILFAALEEVEIFLRTKLAYFHAHKYGAEGYMNPDNYSSYHQKEKFQESLAREIASNGRSAFVLHHQVHYEGHFPVWVIMELFTFGMLSRFYSDMTTADQKQLAKEIYETIPKNVISWLRCCTDLRNICAHYGRLYYRIFPATPANVVAGPTQIHQLWGAVLALQALYPSAGKWNNEILPRLSALFDEYREDIFLRHIGFPVSWEEKLKK